VSVPTLVLQSKDDVIAPLEVGEYVHRAIPGSELVVMEATGHIPILSGAEEVVDQIRRYIT
jgi:sigma-B regulation protein RsbQ